MVKRWVSESAADIPEIAAGILTAYPTQKKFLLSGPLGAGKTTLVKGFCHALGITSGTSSPSFSIVNEYIGTQAVFHFDLYRVKSVDELIEIGLEEYLDSHHFIFIEWPEIAFTLLEEEGFMKINIEPFGITQRMINLEK